MKSRIIRNYPLKDGVDYKEYIDLEKSLFDNGVFKQKLSTGAAGLFLTLKAFANETIDINNTSSDDELEKKRLLNELNKLGLITISYESLNDEKIQVISLNNPDEIL